ncbi:cation/H+ exchanger 4 [Hibiscus trionum]|uniref:Cation/H+ exchanger 4 n=1 Tax=Hibiscus trionum TaxID=183268 RepID=A0A9W7HBI2_HIBTR|nr:cation/H+ exchanger 4 [Hibiscus trionum]GMI74476.1 cation/H+ exchanger 4 [Hibiscus trionum]
MSINNLAFNSSKIHRGEVCLKFPPKVVSPGLPALLLEQGIKDDIRDYSAPRLQLQMFAFYVVTQAIHFLLKYLRLPLFVSQILAGIILRPADDRFLIYRSEDSVSVLGTIGGLGFLFFLFLSGVKMDVSLTFKSGKKAVYIGFLTVMLPLLACLISVHVLEPKGDLRHKFFLAVSYSGTAFPVIHNLLSDTKILNSELGRLGLSAALVGDMVTLVLTLCSLWLKSDAEVGTKRVLQDVGWTLLFIVIVVFVLRPGIKWMVKHIPETSQRRDLCIYLVIMAFMISPRFTQLFHLHPKFGPLILGLVVPDGPPLGSALVEMLDPIVSGLFLPIFATTCGLRLDFKSFKRNSSFTNHQTFGALLTLVVKFGVSLVLAMFCKMPMSDSLALAFIMVSKGIVEVGYYSTMYDSKVISKRVYAQLIIMILLIAIIVPILVKWLYDPSRKYLCFQKRTIMNLKPNQELQVLGCVHVPGNVNSIINLLNVCCPTKESSMAVDVLHLVKLRGRATPLFIAHNKQTATTSDQLYSENVVIAFEQFERDNPNVISANVFTAVSPPNLMYEDICNLAMDHTTSFIILPFHRRWYIDGNIESEDQTIRSLNSKILEMAPCSVGILVEGHHKLTSCTFRDTSSSQRYSSYNIVVIFMGGKDDREALALAKRISQDESVSLTVIHLKPKNSLGYILAENDRTLDDAMLRDIKGSVNIRYLEEQAKDGTATSTYLRTVAEEYQLIIVGRRYKCEDPQTVGLEEWCEFEEIGIIGDLLSSSYFIGNYSLLIVQQQQQRTD